MNSFVGIQVLAKLGQTLDTLREYYKYSAVHNANLRKVQAAFGEPLLTMKEAKHHWWLSHEQAISASRRL